MGKEHILANTEKAKDGNAFNNDIVELLNTIEGIDKDSIKKEERFTSKSIEEIILEQLNLKDIPSDEDLKKIISLFLDNNLVRDSKKNYKQADVIFKTLGDYLLDGLLQKAIFCIDGTTSSRVDRNKAKAQDCLVYKSMGYNFIHIIMFPDDDYMDKKFKENAKREKREVKRFIKEHNFGGLYKKEGLTLVIQYSDIINLFHYIKNKKGQDIFKLIDEWTKIYYKDLYKEYLKEKEEVTLRIFKNIKKEYFN